MPILFYAIFIIGDRMKHVNAKTAFIVKDNLFLLLEEKEVFRKLNSIKDYDISLKTKSLEGSAVPIYFYILLRDRKSREEFKINLKINEKLIEKLYFYLDFVESIVFTDMTTSRLSKAFRVNKYLKKRWIEGVKILQEVYFLRNMLRNS